MKKRKICRGGSFFIGSIVVNCMFRGHFMLSPPRYNMGFRVCYVRKG